MRFFHAAFVCAVFSFLSVPADAARPALTATAVALATSTASQSLGLPVTLTATVTASPGPATGTVTFSDGVNYLGTAPLTANSASFTTSLLGTGRHLLSARYSGDSVYGPSVSAIVLVRIADGLGGSFTPSTSFAVGLAPVWTAMGDLNGDGKPDLAVTNLGDSTLSILLGVGDGTFQPAPGSPYAVGSRPFIPFIADLDGDGKPDVAVSNNGSNTISVLKGNGNGTLQAAINFPAGAAPLSITVSDFNRDGFPDMAVASSGSNQVNILLNNGIGAFATGTPVSLPGSPSVIALGDYNGDGKADLAVTNSSVSGNFVSIFLGAGDGTFLAATPRDNTVGAGPGNVVTADFNADGRADLAVINNLSSTISLLLGNGDGTFHAATSIATGPGPSGLAVADFNADFRPDLAVLNLDLSTSATAVTLFLNQGDGTFLPSGNFAAGTLPAQIIAGAFNNDARVDLAVVNTSAASVEILEGFPASVTTLQVSPNPAVVGQSVTLTASVIPASATGTVTFFDGLTTLGSSALAGGSASISTSSLGLGPHSITASYEGSTQVAGSTSVPVIANIGTATTTLLTASLTSATLGQPVSLIAAVSGSAGTPTGKVTFSAGTVTLGTAPLTAGTTTFTTALLPAGASSVTALYEGDPNNAASVSNPLTISVTPVAGGGFRSPAPISTGISPTAIAIGDFNGDGQADLAIANYDSANITILIGSAQGTFSQPNAPLLTARHPAAIAVGDLNEDGKQDFVVSNSGSSSLSVFLGNGDGTFQTAATIAVPASPFGLVLTDLNNDGNLDIAELSSGTNTLLVHLGNGNGTFHPAVSIAFPSGVTGLRAIAAGDFNRDGRTDLAVTATLSGAGQVEVLLGNGNGSFAPAQAYTVGTGPVAIAAADLKSNGILDLLVVNDLTNNVSVLVGDGTGSFQTGIPAAVGNVPQSLAVGDFNGDGKPDAAVGNSGGTDVTILLGKGDATFQPAISVPAGAAPGALAAGAFDNSGRTDLAVTNLQASTVSILIALKAATITLSATPNPNPSSAPVVLTATVAPADATGTVTFLAGTTELGSSALTSGTATVTATIAPGFQSLTAIYSGDATYGSVVSAPVLDLIGGTPTTTTLTSITPNPSVLGNAVRMAATVGGAFSGTVSFYSGTAFLGVAPVANGTAVLTTSLLPTGAQNVIARFSGTSTLGYSVSAPIAVQVSSVGGFGLTAPTNIATSHAPAGIATGDFNGDGKVDLVAATSGASVFLGNGDGTFLPPLNLIAGSTPSAVAVGDFNGDSKQDLAVANSASASVSVFLGNGSGGFASQLTNPVGTTPSSLAVVDLNGDGIADLAVATQSAGISILLGSGNGSFAPSRFIGVGATNVHIQAADLNRDGFADLAVVSSTGSVFVLLGNGDGTFQPALSYTAGTRPTAVAIGDFDGDGNLDLAVSNSGSSDITLLIGNGNGTFRSPVAIPTASPAQFLATGDFNGDGVLDLAVALQNGNVGILISKGDGTFQAIVPFATGSNPVSLAVANFNGNGTAQVATANQGSGDVSILLDASALVTVVSGSQQIAPTGSAFATPLSVVVTSFGLPLSGVDVVFTAPSPAVPPSASGVFSGGVFSVIVTTGVDGSATAPVFSANAQAGAYSVTATVGRTTATFSLVNNPAACVFTIAPGSFSVDNRGGNSVLSVTASAPGCSWQATSGPDWITFSHAIVNGSGSLTLAVAPNSTGSTRTANLVAAGQTVTVTESYTQQVFVDVPASAYYFDAVNLFAAKGITNGCSTQPALYCPASVVTRAQMAVFLVRAIYGSDNFTAASTPYFTDVPVGSFGFQWIQKLFELGITAGCGPGLYCPDSVVPRDQMAVFLIRMRYGATATPDFNPTPYFTDVPAGAFGFSFIQRLKQDQITSGCAATLYCPSSPVTRGDVAIFLMRGAFNALTGPGYPAIATILPAALTQGQTSTITVTGVSTHFAQGSTSIAPIPGVAIGTVTVSSATSLTVQLTVSGSAPVQPQSIVAITGSEEAVLPNGLIVQAGI